MKNTTQYKIFEELGNIKSNYETTSLEKVPGLRRSQYQVIKMCEYYSDSRYLDGTDIDGRPTQANTKGGRLVPFFNVVNYRVALAKTATDLDVKNIQIVSDNPKYQVHSMLLNREGYEWMKKDGYGLTLNKKGATRPKYGGVLQKKSMIDGRLSIDVLRWTNVWTDQNDIMAGPIVEIHHMSPVEIKSKDKIWDNVRDVLKAHKKMITKDRPTVIDIYEVTGEFPKVIYKNAIKEEESEDDEYEYSLQHYFIADLDNQKFLMYAEELTGKLDDYYEYLAWEDNGYGLGRGVIEDCEESQVWTNDAVINESIAMALAGRVGIKTNSKKLGNNILEHDHGKIYELEDNKDMNVVNFAPAALGQYQNIIALWKGQGNDAATSYNANTGEQPPANTPYSQTALLNQVASKPFDYKREEWGLHESKIWNKWVIPYLIKKIKKEHILVSEFSEEELERIDEAFAVYNTNQVINDRLFNEGKPTSLEEQGAMTDNYKKELKKDGKKRYIKIPEGFFDDIDCKVTVVTTGEEKDKAVILQSLSEITKFVTSTFNPTTGEFGALTDPTLSKIFNEMMEIAGTGISPVSLGKGTKPTKAVPQNPTTPVAPPSPTQMSPALAV